MDVPFALTATAAEHTTDGRVWILGGDFDTLGAPQFPLVLPSMTLVVKILFEPAECDARHNLRVALWDEDGDVIQQPFVHEFTPQRNAQFPTRRVGSLFVLNMQGIAFPQPGDYAFHVLVDDHLMKTIPIYLVQHQIGG